jgi:hypothetical protein
MTDIRPCNDKSYCKTYFDTDPSIQKADYDFFAENPKRFHLVRKPLADELVDARESRVNFIVVRKHASDAFERRGFEVSDKEEVGDSEVLERLDGETLGRILWGVWDVYGSDSELWLEQILLAERAFDDLFKFPQRA